MNLRLVALWLDVDVVGAAWIAIWALLLAEINIFQVSQNTSLNQFLILLDFLHDFGSILLGYVGLGLENWIQILGQVFD